MTALNPSRWLRRLTLCLLLLGALIGCGPRATTPIAATTAADASPTAAVQEATPTVAAQATPTKEATVAVTAPVLATPIVYTVPEHDGTPSEGDPSRYPAEEMVMGEVIRVYHPATAEGYWISYAEPGFAPNESGLFFFDHVAFVSTEGQVTCTVPVVGHIYSSFALPTGELFFARDDGATLSVTLACGDPETRFAPDSYMSLVAADSTGDQLLLTGRRALWLWHRGDSTPTLVSTDMSAVIEENASFSPDGQWIALTHNSATDIRLVRLIRASDGKTMWEVPLGDVSIIGISWPNYEQPPIWLDDSRFLISDSPRGPLLFGLEKDEGQPFLSLFPTLAPTEEMLSDTLGVSDTHLSYRGILYDRRSGAAIGLRIVTPEDQRATTSFSPRAGTMAVIVYNEQSAPNQTTLTIITPAHSTTLSLTGNTISSSWSPDGTQLAVGDDTGLWLVTLLSEDVVATKVIEGTIEGFHWLPDSAHLLVAQQDESYNTHLLFVTLPSEE